MVESKKGRKQSGHWKVPKVPGKLSRLWQKIGMATLHSSNNVRRFCNKAVWYHWWLLCQKEYFSRFFERERLFRYRLIIIRKFFLYHFKVKQFHRKFYLWLFKSGLISESFSLGYIYKKMCKITSMYSKHRYLNSLGRWCSGWWFSIFFGRWKHFLTLSYLYILTDEIATQKGRRQGSIRLQLYKQRQCNNYLDFQCPWPFGMPLKVN